MIFLQLEEISGCVECEDGNVCRGPFRFRVQGEMPQWIGHHCVNPMTRISEEFMCPGGEGAMWPNYREGEGRILHYKFVK